MVATIAFECGSLVTASRRSSAPSVVTGGVARSRRPPMSRSSRHICRTAGRSSGQASRTTTPGRVTASSSSGRSGGTKVVAPLATPYAGRSLRRLPQQARDDAAAARERSWWVFRGAGTALNVATVLVGSGFGVLLGNRLPQRTRDAVTDGLGLVTLMIAAMSAAAVTDTDLADAVGSGGPVLIVLGAILLGGVIGSLLRIEERLEGLGDAIRRRVPASVPDDAIGSDQRHRFVQGFVTASLVFCVGPLTILGSLDDGLGRGIDKLALKATLDGFAALAFAASLGWGVAASALAVGVIQGLLTLAAFVLGGLLPEAHLLAMTATGGLLLVGVSLRLLNIKQVPVGDLLPALGIAPLLVEIVRAAR